MTDKQIIIDDQKNRIHRLQQECTEKTNAIIALGEQLKRKEQENEILKARVKEIGEKMSFLNADRCSEIMRYKQALEEIKEYINSQGIDNKWNMRIQRFRMGILNKINEVLK